MQQKKNKKKNNLMTQLKKKFKKSGQNQLGLPESNVTWQLCVLLSTWKISWEHCWSQVERTARSDLCVSWVGQKTCTLPKPPQQMLKKLHWKHRKQKAPSLKIAGRGGEQVNHRRVTCNFTPWQQKYSTIFKYLFYQWKKAPSVCFIYKTDTWSFG